MAIHALRFVFGVWLFQQMRVMPSLWLALLFFPLIFLFLFQPAGRRWLSLSGLAENTTTR
jgi:accessory gene regulator protein AgrB